MGRLVEEKGIDLIIEALPDIRKKVSDVELDIIGPLNGDGFEDFPVSPYVKSLYEKAEKLGVASIVNFKGLQRGADKYRLLSQSWVFVNPTTAIEEAFTNVNIEALASGVPVVTTDWSGNKELIKDGVNGHIIDVFEEPKGNFTVDRDQLCRRVTEILLASPEKINTLKKNVAETAKKFDYKKTLPNLISCLEKKTLESHKSEGWQKLKHKYLLDFKHLFEKDFLFFLYFHGISRTDNFNTVYENKVLMKEVLKREEPVSIENLGETNKVNAERNAAIRQAYISYFSCNRF